MSTPIFPLHKTRSESTQEKQRGSLAGRIIQLRTARAKAQHPIALHPPPNMGTRGTYWGRQKKKQNRLPHAPQNGPKSANFRPFWDCNHLSMHACMQACIYQAVDCHCNAENSPSELTAQQQGSGTAVLSKRTTAKDTFVGGMR